MAAGDILREGLMVVEEVTVKANEDIEKGEIIYNDGAGFLAMPNTAVNAKAYMALEDHTYATASVHTIKALLMGKATVQKKNDVVIKQGQRVMISATAGEITLFVKGAGTTSGDAQHYSAAVLAETNLALDTDARIIGNCAKDATETSTTCDVWLGVF